MLPDRREVEPDEVFDAVGFEPERDELLWAAPERDVPARDLLLLDPEVLLLLDRDEPAPPEEPDDREPDEPDEREPEGRELDEPDEREPDDPEDREPDEPEREPDEPDELRELDPELLLRPVEREPLLPPLLCELDESPSSLSLPFASRSFASVPSYGAPIDPGGRLLTCRE